ncbi:hypothetical protein PUN28_003915 [Cardiocondyla obscurior]|uniref:Uncharacterized protein n=1 Tax=Cardiocondyla obscurior TaxID=286306 RepID=A0AAW2GNM2_9HYME
MPPSSSASQHRHASLLVNLATVLLHPPAPFPPLPAPLWPIPTILLSSSTPPPPPPAPPPSSHISILTRFVTRAFHPLRRVSPTMLLRTWPGGIYVFIVLAKKRRRFSRISPATLYATASRIHSQVTTGIYISFSRSICPSLSTPYLPPYNFFFLRTVFIFLSSSRFNTLSTSLLSLSHVLHQGWLLCSGAFLP